MVIKEKDIICNCGCGQNFIDNVLYSFLENFLKQLEIFTGKKCTLMTSCVNRCPAKNKSCGGSTTSKHLKGSAWDGFAVYQETGKRVDAKIFFKVLKLCYQKNIISGGLGYYFPPNKYCKNYFAHIDTGLKRVWGFIGETYYNSLSINDFYRTFGIM
ncbi:MAG: hypothetical protein JW917_00845 [Ignavibacteria bacterium]|nr:hypothetical protein [Ignavibacteria bacterium]